MKSKQYIISESCTDSGQHNIIDWTSLRLKSGAEEKIYIIWYTKLTPSQYDVLR